MGLIEDRKALMDFVQVQYEKLVKVNNEVVAAIDEYHQKACLNPKQDCDRNFRLAVSIIMQELAEHQHDVSRIEEFLDHNKGHDCEH